VTTSQWLLGIHLLGVFLLVGGSVLASTFNLFAQRSRRPSDIAVFFKLRMVGVVAIATGAIVTLVFGLWLVHDRGYGFGQTWIVLSVLFWILAFAAGQIGGQRDRRTRAMAEELAAGTNEATPELVARLNDPVTLTMLYGTVVLLIASLAIMVWKPGA
jgi:uncharacterized membrane protein